MLAAICRAPLGQARINFAPTYLSTHTLPLVTPLRQVSMSWTNRYPQPCSIPAFPPARPYSATASLQGGRHTTTQPDRKVHWRQHLSKKAQKRYKVKAGRQQERNKLAIKQQEASLGISAQQYRVPLPSSAEIHVRSRANRAIIESIIQPEPAVPTPAELLKTVDSDALIGAITSGFIEQTRPNFNYALRVLAAQGKFEEALLLFRGMATTGIEPSTQTFNALLAACAEQRNVPAAFKIFEHQRTLTNAFLSGKTESVHLIGISQSSSLPASKEQRGSMPYTGSSIVPLWHQSSPTLILAKSALTQCPMAPNAVTYGALVQACIRGLDLESAYRTVEVAEADGVKLNQVIFTELIVGCVHAGQYERAWDTFKHMRRYHCEPDSVTFTALINACAKTDQVEKALNLIQEMKQMHLSLTTVTYNSIIHAAARSFRRANYAHELFHEMKAAGFAPDERTFNSVILACSHSGDVPQARQYMWQMAKQRIKPSIFTMNTLLAVYARALRPRHAQQVPVNLLPASADGRALLELEDDGPSSLKPKPAIGDYARLVEGDIDDVVENLLADYYQDDKQPRVDPEEEKVNRIVESDDVSTFLPNVSHFNQDVKDADYADAKAALVSQGLDKALVAAFEADNEKYPALNSDEEVTRISIDAAEDNEWRVQAEATAVQLMQDEEAIERAQQSLSQLPIAPSASSALQALPQFERFRSGKLLFDEFLPMARVAHSKEAAIAEGKKMSFVSFMKDMERSIEAEVLGADGASASIFDSDGEIGGKSLDELLDIRNIPVPPADDSEGEHDPIKLHDYYARTVASRVLKAMEAEFGDDTEVLKQLESDLLNSSGAVNVVTAGSPVPQIADHSGASYGSTIIETIPEGAVTSAQIQELHTGNLTPQAPIVLKADNMSTPVTTEDAAGMVRRRRSGNEPTTANPLDADVFAASSLSQEADFESMRRLMSMIQEQGFLPDSTGNPVRDSITSELRSIDPQSLLQSPNPTRRVFGRVLTRLLRTRIIPGIDAALVRATDTAGQAELRSLKRGHTTLLDVLRAANELTAASPPGDSSTVAHLDGMLQGNGKSSKRLSALANMSHDLLAGVEWLPSGAHTHRKAQLLEEAAYLYHSEMRKLELKPDQITANTMLTAFCFAEKKVSAYKFLAEEYPKWALQPDSRTLRSLVAMHVRLRETKPAEHVIKSMQSLGVAPDRDTRGLLLHAYAREWRLKDAINVVKEMKACGQTPSEHHAFLLRQRCKEAGIVHADVPPHPVAWQFTPAVLKKRRAHSRVINKMAALALRPQLRNGWR